MIHLFFYSAGRLTSPNSLSDEDDSLMVAIDAYEVPVNNNIEKSLTNLNVNIATMAQQLEEFSDNFNKQQQLLFEKISLLRIEASDLTW